MTTFMKQLAINRILLPYDMIFEINGFVFHERENIDRIYKQKWETCMNSIRNAIVANRNIPYDNTNYYDVEWAFWGDEQSPQFQAINCSVCGGYTVTDTINISRKIVCTCNGNGNTEEEEDDAYDY